jgi:hypothetical protein
MLAIATGGIVVVAYFFCRAVPVPGSPYAAVPSLDPDGTSRLHLRRTKSAESMHLHSHSAGGRYADHWLGTARLSPSPVPPFVAPSSDPNPDEESSLISKSTSSSTSSDEENIRDAESTRTGSSGDTHSDAGAGVAPHVDIRGWALMRSSEFWLLFTMTGALGGVGLMTIK